jgi:outer membrane biosynthesis protein TonB
MNEPGNVFDVSTTLMEIDDLPEGDGEVDAGPDEVPPALKESEPHYFTSGGVAKQSDLRRRALAAVGLAAGGVVVIALGSAAVGFGHGPTDTTPPVASPTTQPTIERYGDAAEQVRRPQAPAGPREHRERLGRAASPSTHKPKPHPHPRHRHHADPSPAPAPQPEPTYTPEPEPTYVPEPESTYVPVEETAPPPPPPAPSGGGQEFGIEP